MTTRYTVQHRSIYSSDWTDVLGPFYSEDEVKKELEFFGPYKAAPELFRVVKVVKEIIELK